MKLHFTPTAVFFKPLFLPYIIVRYQGVNLAFPEGFKKQQSILFNREDAFCQDELR